MTAGSYLDKGIGMYVCRHVCTVKSVVNLLSLDKIQWKSTLTSLKVKNFRDTVGPRHALPDSLLDMFRLFFTRALLEYIVLQTNQYALECMGGEKYTNWSPLTVKELEATSAS